MKVIINCTKRVTERRFRAHTVYKYRFWHHQETSCVSDCGIDVSMTKSVTPPHHRDAVTELHQPPPPPINTHPARTAHIWEILGCASVKDWPSHFPPRPHRQDLSWQVQTAGQRLVRGGRVRVAGGRRPRGIGWQIQSQRHRRHRAAQSHQGNAGVRAAHRWGGRASRTAQSVQGHMVRSYCRLSGWKRQLYRVTQSSGSKFKLILS